MDVASRIFSLWAESGYVDQRLLVDTLQTWKPARPTVLNVSRVEAHVRNAKQPAFIHCEGQRPNRMDDLAMGYIIGAAQDLSVSARR
jgi:hypothetical protein